MSENQKRRLSTRFTVAIAVIVILGVVIIVTLAKHHNQAPTADTTEEARARNRRVEIAIIDTLIDFKPGRR